MVKLIELLKGIFTEYDIMFYLWIFLPIGVAIVLYTEAIKWLRCGLEEKRAERDHLRDDLEGQLGVNAHSAEQYRASEKKRAEEKRDAAEFRRWQALRVAQGEEP